MIHSGYINRSSINAMKVTCHPNHLVCCLFIQLCCHLVLGIVVPRYKIRHPLTGRARALVSLHCKPLSNTADDAYTTSDAIPAIPEVGLTTAETLVNSADSEETLSTAASTTASVSSAISETGDVTTRNKRPPLASKTSDVYANIYRGLYNLPLEMEEEEKFDEIENTSFYSNIRYSYGDDEEIDDFPEVRSSIVSKISDSSFGDDFSISAKLPNERPPLISSMKQDKKSDLNQDDEIDDEIVSVNKRPPLRRKTPLLVDGFAIQPIKTAAEKTRSMSDMEGVFANIYSGLYNQPFTPEEEVIDDDEIENTSFYSNIRYSSEEDDDDDFEETKSTLGSKLGTIENTIDSNAANSGPFTANERPPLLSSAEQSVNSAGRSVTGGEKKLQKSSEERSSQGFQEQQKNSAGNAEFLDTESAESTTDSLDDKKKDQNQNGERQGSGGDGISRSKVRNPTPSLPCVSTVTNSVHIVGERMYI